MSVSRTIYLKRFFLFVLSTLVFVPNFSKSLEKGCGELEVICGPTCSGKTTTLINRLKDIGKGGFSFICFKYDFNSAGCGEGVITSRNGDNLKAFLIKDSSYIEMLATDVLCIGIDEAQFFSADIVTVIDTLVRKGKKVIVAGLDLNFRLVPFTHMPLLMAMSDKVVKLKAKCVCCGNDAGLGQRIIDQEPAKFDIPDPIGVLRPTERYEPRCRRCFQIDHKINLTGLAKEYSNVQQAVR